MYSKNKMEHQYDYFYIVARLKLDILFFACELDFVFQSLHFKGSVFSDTHERPLAQAPRLQFLVMVLKQGRN